VLPTAAGGSGAQGRPYFVNPKRFYFPFQLACDSKSPKIIRTALDSLQKLMEYGHISGSMMTKVDGQDQRLVNLVVDSICRSFTGDSTDEGVQLQIIKALLTAVSSNVCDVHEGHLLKAVRTIYNIYLISKNLVNQTTAKATLTQMMNLVFQRMESLGTADELNAELNEINGVVAEKKAPVEGATADESSTDPTQDEAAPAPDAGADAAGEVAAAEEKEAAPTAAGEAEVEDGRSSPTGDEKEGADEDVNSRFLHVYRKDAFLVFRSMCKLSMAVLPNKEVIDSKSHELRSKLLSLELQLSILQNAGPVFQSDPLFIDVVVKYLCVALSKNGVSHVPSVFNLALSIFIALVQNFRHHLKMQIEVFFKEILLSMLEISTSSFQHKWSVLICLARLCSQPQTVVDLYLNYDCDEYLNNVFERMINDLARVAQGRASSELGGNPQQESEMKVKGLECLVLIVRAMRDWCKDMDETHPSAAAAAAAADAAADAIEAADDEGDAGPLSPGPPDGEEEGGGGDFEERKRRKDMLEKGIKLFNTKPKKGIAFLQENDLLGKTPTDVAAMLLRDERLDKTQIGEYLGEPTQVNLDTMHAYTDLIDFKGYPVYVDALRLFLSSFRLPGEAQKIDRLMEKFAGTWYGCHPKNEVFASPDAAYVLAYSLIMLNVDAHSDKIVNKMSLDAFVSNNRGIGENGTDLPRELLASLYSSIVSNEIRLEQREFISAVKEGWLFKQGGRVKTWKKRCVPGEPNPTTPSTGRASRLQR
jgi:brefeldin A-inhibited guanine nucleotide-exchange protein